jgi:rhodanese-related sulfurtransferase
MTTSQIILYSLLALVVLVYLRRFLLTRGITRYSPSQLADRLKQGDVVLLDVRTPAEFRSGNIRGAVLIPLQELHRRSDELQKHKGQEIVCYCQSGSRSLVAAAQLRKKGLNAAHLEGGMAEWNFSQTSGR